MNYRTSLPTGLALVIVSLLAMSSQVDAQGAQLRAPQPGEIYKEYTYIIPNSGFGTNNHWRVTDPNATAQGSPGNNPGTYLPNQIMPNAPASMSLDLAGATKAEALLDLWGGHVGTIGKRFRIINVNGGSQTFRPWINIPELGTAGNGQFGPECYTQQLNPVINVPLSYLSGNIRFQGTSGGQTCNNFNWGQWGWYTFTLRIYYGASKPHPTGSISSHSNGGQIFENATVTASTNGSVSRVEFFAYYDGYDTDGDGIYTQYHESYHRDRFDGSLITRNHVGTDTTAPYAVTFNTNFVPNQNNMRLIARIRGTNGVWYVTNAVTGLSMARSGTVRIYKPQLVPNNFWVRAGQTKTCRWNITQNLSGATSATMLITTWNGIDGQSEGNATYTRINGNGSTALNSYGKDHFYAYDEVPIPLSFLNNGFNTFLTHSSSIHHGREIMWPGPALIVRYGGPAVQPPGPPTGLNANATSQTQINLNWNNSGSGITYNLYRSTSSGFTPGGGNRIAAGLIGTSFTNSGLQPNTTYYYKLTALNSGGESNPSGQTQATTMSDNTPPTIANASAQDPFSVQILFSENLHEPSAENVNNYNLVNGAPIPINSATLGPDQRTVTLATGQLPIGVPLTVSVNGVLDLSPTPNAANDSETFQFLNLLLAHWPFDEGTGTTSADLSGNNHTGTLNGASWFSQTPDGSNSSICFDGVNDYVDVGPMDVAGNAVSFTAWIHPLSFNIGDGRIISKADDVPDSGHTYMISTLQVGDDYYLRGRLRTGATTKLLIATSGPVDLNAWCHVALTYNGNTLRLYKDGELVGSTPVTGTIPTQSGIQTAIGNQPQNAGERPFHGYIDDVRIYGRALSLLEINNLQPDNFPPSTNPETYPATEDTQLTVTQANGVLDNDNDPESDPLTASLVTTTPNGTLNLAMDGSFTYLPNENFNGQDTFTYQANDATGSSSPQAVTINVAAVNDAPTAMPNSYTINEGEVLNVPADGVLGNDDDVDGDPLTAILTMDANSGQLALGSNGSIIYTPNIGFSGPDSFQYKANDGNLDSAPVTVMIQVNEVIFPYTAVNDIYSATEDVTLNVNAANGVMFNDLSPEGIGPSVVVELVMDTTNGDLTLNPDGSFDYVPDPNTNGTDTFSYRLNNGALSNTATVMLNVAAVPDAPVAVDNTYSVTTGGTLTVTLGNNILLNDSDADGDSLTAINFTSTSDGTLTPQSDGTFTYMHNGGPATSDSFDYQAFDGSTASNVATVTINIEMPDAGLVAYWPFDEGSGTNAEDVAGNNDGTHSAATWGSPSENGTPYVTLDGVDDVINVPTFDIAGDQLTMACWFRADDFGQVDGRLISKADDVKGNDHIWMLSTMRTPFASPTGLIYLRARVRSAGITTTLTAPNGVLAPNTWTHAAAVYDGSELRLYKDGVEVGSVPMSGPIDMDPAVGVAIGNQPPGAGARPFDGCIDDVRVYDRALSLEEIEALADVSQPPVAPTANDDDYNATEDTLFSRNAASGVLFNDVNPGGGSLTASLVDDADNGDLTLQPDGSFTYDPDLNFFGQDTFTYTASNGVTSNTATVTINVAPVNDPPMTVGNTYNVTGGTLTVPDGPTDVLNNDNDVEGDPLTAVLVDNASFGNVVLMPNGSFTYTHTGGSGTDSFTYRAVDSAPGNVATVNLFIDTLQNGLIHHWRMDEGNGSTAFDSAGDADGMLVGPVQDSSTGMPSLLFDGDDDYVGLGPLDVPAGTGAMTLCGWFYANSFNIYDSRFITKASGTSESDHYWMVSTIPNSFDTPSQYFLRFRLKAGGTTTTLVGNGPGGLLPLNDWNFFAAVYDGTEMRLYVNGTQVGSTPKTGLVDRNAAVNAAIGNQPPGAGPRSWDGNLYDFRMYDRALNLSEINALAD
ncbi:MAG: Ig-like domain-containing protein [Planctomycetota bacterium]